MMLLAEIDSRVVGFVSAQADLDASALHSLFDTQVFDGFLKPEQYDEMMQTARSELIEARTVRLASPEEVEEGGAEAAEEAAEGEASSKEADSSRAQSDKFGLSRKTSASGPASASSNVQPEGGSGEEDKASGNGSQLGSAAAPSGGSHAGAAAPTFERQQSFMPEEPQVEVTDEEVAAIVQVLCTGSTLTLTLVPSTLCSFEDEHFWEWLFREATCCIAPSNCNPAAFLGGQQLECS